MSAEDAVRAFSASGEIPMILGEGRIYLQPFNYANERAHQIKLEVKKRLRK